MGLLPTYRIKESALKDFSDSLLKEGYAVQCTKEQHLLRNGKDLYREWLIKDEKEIRVIFWDRCPVADKSKERYCIVTIASPDGRLGKNLSNSSIEILKNTGAVDLVDLYKQRHLDSCL
jgi:hypothetical protein